MIVVIKRNKKRQEFNKDKLRASLYSSCLGAGLTAQASKTAANEATKETLNWLKIKSEVSSNDIRQAAGQYLLKINHHAGYLYLHHRIMW